MANLRVLGCGAFARQVRIVTQSSPSTHSLTAVKHWKDKDAASAMAAGEAGEGTVLGPGWRNSRNTQGYKLPR